MMKKVFVFENQKSSNWLGEAIMTSSYPIRRWSNSLHVSHKMPEKNKAYQRNWFLFVTNIFIFGINYWICHPIYILIQIEGFLFIFKGVWLRFALLTSLFMGIFMIISHGRYSWIRQGGFFVWISGIKSMFSGLKSFYSYANLLNE